MTGPVDNSHSAAAQGTTAGAAAPRARVASSFLHASIAAGTAQLFNRDVPTTKMNLSPLFTSNNRLQKDHSDLKQQDVRRAYFTNALAATREGAQCFRKRLLCLPRDLRDNILMKMIPDNFIIVYLVETVAPDKLEKALTDAGIDMTEQYKPIEGLIAKCAPSDLDLSKAKDFTTPEHFFNSYHRDTPIAQFISIIETCGGLPIDVLAKSGELDHGLPIEFVNQNFVDATIDLREKFLTNENLTSYSCARKGLLLLPKNIAQFKGLKTLYLGNNQITFLPAEFFQLPALKALYLDNNQITSLPAAVEQLTALETLRLLNNQLKSLPDELGKIQTLTRLDVRNNYLTSLPPGLGDFNIQLQTQKKPIAPANHTGKAGKAEE